ncbi:uncharacterized protein LOC102288691 [Haplochromis burtoni]|uniref:uncharacterized protein LOC102288691 n=1 Tax=Haplochromis burtoni TaxID=8153 RepID=UPI001C2DD33A|nr:uncharacterized protein LOC102288691 [Haplochromis burtoni]
MLTLSFVGKQPQDIIFLLKAGNITLFLVLVVVSTVLIFFIKKKNFRSTGESLELQESRLHHPALNQTSCRYTQQIQHVQINTVGFDFNTIKVSIWVHTRE